MACKLFYKHGSLTFKLGSFRNREKAEEYWNYVKELLRDRLGEVTPVYVETGKGKGK